jgi:Uma2 family endonuclease
MQDTGDPSTLAPEICVEVLNGSNTVDEMTETRVLYREAGAEEVWLVEHDGRIRFFGEQEIRQSAIALECPARV